MVDEGKLSEVLCDFARTMVRLLVAATALRIRQVRRKQREDQG